MDKVAVVILNWNGEEMLRRFLPGVLAHTSAEVYVVDNASTDKSLELLSVDFPAVKTILLERNYGFAEGYNRALAQIEAEYFVFGRGGERRLDFSHVAVFGYPSGGSSLPT